jgi:hypothetical protein
MFKQGQSAAKTVEISEAYQGYVDQCMAKYQPVGAVETRLVRTMAHSLWSLNQVHWDVIATYVDWQRRERSTEIFFRTLLELRVLQLEEDREVRELQRIQAADFAAYISRRPN